MIRTSMGSVFQAKLSLPYEQAIEKVKAALQKEGFGVLTEIDVKATLKKKLDVDFRKYAILGACNPPLAHRTLQADLEIGLRLPCNAIVYEEDSGTMVEMMDPVALMTGVRNPELQTLAQEAQAKIQRVVRALGE